MTPDEQRNLEEITMAYRSHSDVQWLVRQLARLTGDRAALREQLAALRLIEQKAIAFRDACAAETFSGWLKEAEDRQVELFDALEAPAAGPRAAVEEK